LRFQRTPRQLQALQAHLFYTLALSAYQVETGKNDSLGSNVYAIRSALKAYNSELATNPKAHDKKFDHLLKLDADGQLSPEVEKLGCGK
jgi:hypothetical protein